MLAASYKYHADIGSTRWQILHWFSPLQLPLSQGHRPYPPVNNHYPLLQTQLWFFKETACSNTATLFTAIIRTVPSVYGSHWHTFNYLGWCLPSLVLYIVACFAFAFASCTKGNSYMWQEAPCSGTSWSGHLDPHQEQTQGLECSGS